MGSFLLLLTASLCHADTLPWNARGQGQFVTALCADHQGRTVIATEDQGLWRWNPAIRQYDHFTAKDGLASDDVYALAVDARGRLWAGTLRGLSVYNGKSWKTYGPLEGVGGWRTFALAVCPVDGDIWIATEGGLTRYSLHTGTWTQYSRLDGLPANACSCLAFAPDGTLYAGTQADGIVVASPRTDYRTWRTVPGPAMPPPSPGGDGLPSALTNALLVTRDGTIYCATDDGLARSPNGGHSWRFLRGADWQAMVKGEWHGPAPVATDTGGHLLAEDYVTTLAEDGAGHLFIGHRRKGVGVYDERTTLGATPPGAYGGYTDALLAQGNGQVLIGTYGDGLTSLALADAMLPPPVAAKLLTAFPPLPAPAAPPTLAQMNAMLKIVSAVPPDPREFLPHAVAMDEDWQTEGDWLGRYGRYSACLCAICSPSDYQWGAGWEPVYYASQMGPDHKPGDKLRYYITWLYTSDPRVMEMPPTYLDSRIKRGLTDGSKPRREAEQDDHAETYPTTRDALGVYETVTVPPGLYILSVYEMNKDGHAGDNRDRDYRLSVRPHAAVTLADVSGFDGEPEWAHERVSQFWGGVWERFLVRGPVTLDVEAGRNHSHNTIVQSVTLDLADETPPPYYGTPLGRLLWRNAHYKLLMAQWKARKPLRPARTEAAAAGRLFAALDGLQFTNSTWWGVSGRRFFLPLTRWYAAQAALPGARPGGAQWRRLGTCEYEVGLYSEWEGSLRRAGVTPARDMEKALRFDGTNGMGHGYEAITQYLTAPTASNPGTRAQFSSLPTPIFSPEGGGL